MTDRYSQPAKIKARADCKMVQTHNGDWVRFEDYKALEAYALAAREKLEAAEELIEDLEGIVDAYGCDCAADVRQLVAAYRAPGEGDE